MKQEIEKVLAEKGYKLTNQRKAILKAFEDTEKHLLTAQEVFEKVSSGMNFSTVYRNLEMLTKINVLNRVILAHGVSAFELKTQDHHHHHLICKSCGKTKTINFCPFEAFNADPNDDFVATDHKFEIYGLCKKCQR